MDDIGSRFELEVDEAELSKFFGTQPSDQDSEEKEFFGTSIFDIHQGDLVLSVSFSTSRRDMILDIALKSTGQKFLNIKIGEIAELRIRDDSKRLLVMKRTEGSNGADPNLIEAASITVDPISLSINGE